MKTDVQIQKNVVDELSICCINLNLQKRFLQQYRFFDSPIATSLSKLLLGHPDCELS